VSARGAGLLAAIAVLAGGGARADEGALAGDGPSAPPVSDETGFVDFLLGLGLAEEAGREASRLMFVAGADAVPPKTAARIGLAMAMAGEPARAVPFLNHAATAARDPEDADRWQLAAGVASLRAQVYPHAFHLFARVETFGVDEPMRARAARLGCIGVVLAHDADGARACVPRLLAPAAFKEDTADALEMLDINPRRRGFVGGALSAVIPGLGQATAGNPGDASVAFVLNGATFAAAAVLFAQGAAFDATLFALGVGLRYYMGNINNGASAWRAAAERRRRDATTLLLRQLAPPPR
jgi:hypothetical protein